MCASCLNTGELVPNLLRMVWLESSGHIVLGCSSWKIGFGEIDLGAAALERAPNSVLEGVV